MPHHPATTIYIDNNVKWIGTYGAGLVKFDGINWTIYDMSNSGIPSNVIWSIYSDVQSNKWIATEFGGAAKFNTNNNVWTVYNTSNSGIPDNNTRSVIVDLNNNKWIGTDGGGMAGYNDTDWVMFNPSNSPLPDITVLSFSVDKFNNLWISTLNGLAVYNKYGVVGVNNITQKIPDHFQLYQNCPNPFNPSTQIKFNIGKSSTVRIIVYDVLGEEVLELLNKKLSPGTYTAEFNGSNYPSGIYFYELITDYQQETKKMVLLK
jgi:hypothetical protein